MAKPVVALLPCPPISSRRVHRVVLGMEHFEIVSIESSSGSIHRVVFRVHQSSRRIHRVVAPLAFRVHQSSRRRVPTNIQRSVPTNIQRSAN
jgi:hypothetical protein